MTRELNAIACAIAAMNGNLAAHMMGVAIFYWLWGVKDQTPPSIYAAAMMYCIAVGSFTVVESVVKAGYRKWKEEMTK